VSIPPRPGDDVPGAPPPLLSDRHRVPSPSPSPFPFPVAEVAADQPEVPAAAVPPAAAAGRTGSLVLTVVLVGGAVAMLLRRRASRVSGPVGAQW
jgi:hypothetical protein